MMDMGMISAVGMTVFAGVLTAVWAWRSLEREEGRAAARAAFWPELEAMQEREDQRRAEWVRALGVSHRMRLTGGETGHRATCGCGWSSPVLVSAELATAAWIAHWQGAAS